MSIPRATGPMTPFGAPEPAKPPKPARRWSVGKLFGRLIGGLLGLAFAATMLTVIVTIGIWPGEAKLTAPLLCPEGRTDAFVVADQYNPRPGETVINFSLHCVGEHGEVVDAGFFRPFMLMIAFHGALILGLVLLLKVVRKLGGSGDGSGRRSTDGTLTPDPYPHHHDHGIDHHVFD